ncbi:hypothetical protein SLNWT_7035 [Streptomyces albus]|uniref:Uncharacterized protein n=1 Tax=Streptomyces albus (strain ATCC 21838 / DSM 41398 / FERM P-419 / JCM 4703 / NBRC 107858) TaxID=1081613 RepID=A0A0B5F9A1_STRA4|nr:hypothetical protein SLNWT_7035 [Streptomyces albus]AOU81714.1 hypothetical protein SLNHY_7023 [Streptomyces albus]AYN37404.1 hypothetical protein DUI70_6911 [Streptomyces albus]
MQPPPTPAYSPIPDPLTPDRDITHAHFQAGDTVVVLKGVAGGELWGDAMRVIAPSWHTPTDEDGWRLRDATGGARSYLTAHPRYLVHLARHCPDCLIHLRAMEDVLRARFAEHAEHAELIDCGWYTTTALDQLVHIADARGDR